MDEELKRLFAKPTSIFDAQREESVALSNGLGCELVVLLGFTKLRGVARLSGRFRKSTGAETGACANVGEDLPTRILRHTYQKERGTQALRDVP